MGILPENYGTELQEATLLSETCKKVIIVQNLPMGKHHIEFETFFAEEAQGSNVEICTIGIIR